jgi:hypothetical protein
MGFSSSVLEKASCQNQQIAMKKIGLATFFYALLEKVAALGTSLT